MNHIKLLFVISLLVSTITSKSQNTFIDSSTYYSFALSSGLGVIKEYIKETVKLDSINSNGEFYSVSYYASKYRYQTIYKLRSKDNKVFFTGKTISTNRFYSDSTSISNLLVYDFNLNKGDTMVIYDSIGRVNIHLLIDSIKDVYYKDGKIRQTQYTSIIPPFYINPSTVLYTMKGLGSNFGLLPIQIINTNVGSYYQKLISVCDANNNLVFLNSNEFSGIDNYCDETEISYLVRIQPYSIESKKFISINLFPNPVINKLNIDGITEGTFSIYNTAGKLVDFGNIENSISTANLQEGLYFIEVKHENNTYYAKFMKH